MLRIRTGHCSCPCVVISVLGLLSSFEYIVEEVGTMTHKGMVLLLLAGTLFVPQLEAQIKHIEMRVEGMT